MRDVRWLPSAHTSLSTHTPDGDHTFADKPDNRAQAIVIHTDQRNRRSVLSVQIDGSRNRFVVLAAVRWFHDLTVREQFVDIRDGISAMIGRRNIRRTDRTCPYQQLISCWSQLLFSKIDRKQTNSYMSRSIGSRFAFFRLFFGIAIAQNVLLCIHHNSVRVTVQKNVTIRILFFGFFFTYTTSIRKKK